MMSRLQLNCAAIPAELSADDRYLSSREVYVGRRHHTIRSIQIELEAFSTSSLEGRHAVV